MDGRRLRSGNVLFALVAITALALTIGSRVPISPSALSFDNVNFAFAIHQFNPWNHQPQPPGYPFFVAEARIVDFVFHDAEKTFIFISTFVTWLSVLMAFLLGRQMFGAAAGVIGSALLIFNPTLWSAGLDSPLRPHLAFFSLLVAYLCWRIWKGEPRFALLAALALGIGSGFRPDLLVYLFPLWCAAMWKSESPLQAWIRGIGIVFAFTVVWLGVAAYAVGGLDRYVLMMWVYSFSAMTDTSVLIGISVVDWFTRLTYMVAWTGVGLLSWLWIVPVWLRKRRPGGNESSWTTFLIAWIAPGVIAQALLHVAAPGHTLFSIVALCLLGGHLIAAACDGFPRRLAPRLQVLATGVAVGLNILLFFNAIPFPAMSPDHFMYAALLDGIRGTTFDDLQSNNQLSEASVRQLKDLVRGDRPAVIVSTAGSSQHFRFLSSRIASYYVDDRDIWVVVDEQNPPSASRIRGKNLLEIRYGAIVKVPVPRGARIIWLMDPSSPFRDAVSKVVALEQDGNLFHTDLAHDRSSFRVENFEFVVGTEGESGQIEAGNRPATRMESRQTALPLRAPVM